MGMNPFAFSLSALRYFVCDISCIVAREEMARVATRRVITSMQCVKTSKSHPSRFFQRKAMCGNVLTVDPKNTVSLAIFRPLKFPAVIRSKSIYQAVKFFLGSSISSVPALLRAILTPLRLSHGLPEQLPACPALNFDSADIPMAHLSYLKPDFRLSRTTVAAKPTSFSSCACVVIKRFPACLTCCCRVWIAFSPCRHIKTLLGKAVSDGVGTVRETVRRAVNYSAPSPFDCIRNYTRSSVLGGN